MCFSSVYIYLQGVRHFFYTLELYKLVLQIQNHETQSTSSKQNQFGLVSHKLFHAHLNFKAASFFYCFEQSSGNQCRPADSRVQKNYGSPCIYRDSSNTAIQNALDSGHLKMLFLKFFLHGECSQCVYYICSESEKKLRIAYL